MLVKEDHVGWKLSLWSYSSQWRENKNWTVPWSCSETCLKQVKHLEPTLKWNVHWTCKCKGRGGERHWSVGVSENNRWGKRRFALFHLKVFFFFPTHIFSSVASNWTLSLALVVLLSEEQWSELQIAHTYVQNSSGQYVIGGLYEKEPSNEALHRYTATGALLSENSFVICCAK